MIGCMAEWESLSNTQLCQVTSHCCIDPNALDVFFGLNWVGLFGCFEVGDLKGEVSDWKHKQEIQLLRRINCAPVKEPSQ